MNIHDPVNEQAISPGLSMIHSNRMEALREVAVKWINTHPLKPLENEVFIVHSNGMAQWLKLALAEDSGCGISAALDIQLPARFLWNAYREMLGDEKIPRESPYDKPRLIWRLLRMLPSLSALDAFAPLTQYLADDQDQRKRYQLAGHLADLYDQYQVYRADWLEDWGSGSDQLRNAKGASMPLPPQHAWQAELWRRIRRDIPKQQRDLSRSSLHGRFLAATQKRSVGSVALPRRVIVFGISSLPKQALEALHAISRHSQVLLFVHNPCRHYWADIIEDRELLRIEHARHKYKSQWPQSLSLEMLHQHANPLLAAWAKQGRDYIGLLYGYDQPDDYRQWFSEIDLFSDFTKNGGSSNLLQQVQQAILELNPLPPNDETKPTVSQDDHSICFHLSHSRQREVEILQDQLLDLFDRISGLNPRDIIVMTPNIDTYASHIEAVFGNLPLEDPRYIPFTIADRPERNSIPMLQALEKLLHLPASRMTAGDIMDLLEVPAFRERFGLGVADLPKLHQWIRGAGIRWGLNGDQRQVFDLPAGIEQNSWLFGLRRMLLGYAVGIGDPWRNIEPYDEIGGLEAALVGPLCAILEQLEKYWNLLRHSATARTWHLTIQGLMQTFFQPTGSHDELTLMRMADALDQWLEACEEAKLEEALTLAVVRDALMGTMTDASISQRFLAGRVNFCTLMPMRAIPFKVVCLLGMNDGEYPRNAPPLDFDLMSAPGQYRPGDRSRREDDRYLCLEALLSAREKLYISYIGRSVQDNSERMPSVLVGQLRDYLDAGWQTEAKDQQLLDQLTCLHPLQPFSKTYFQSGEKPHLFTYAREWREVLDRPPEPPNDGPLSAPAWEGPLALNHLIRFLKNPIHYFYNQRLSIYFGEMEAPPENQEPFQMDILAHFGPGKHLLSAGLAASSENYTQAVQQAARRLQGTGELPVGSFGQLEARKLIDPVLMMLKHHHHLKEAWPHALEAVEIQLPVRISECGCSSLEDWLDNIRQPETKPSANSSTALYGRWEYYQFNVRDTKGTISRAHPFIATWIKHLAGCAQGLDLTSYLIAHDGPTALIPVKPTTARKWLNTLIGYWWRSLQQPLPVTAKTALAYLGAKDRQKGLDAARKAYEGDRGELGYPGEGPYLKRDFPNFDTLQRAGDMAFENLANELYGPLTEILKEGEQP